MVKQDGVDKTQLASVVLIQNGGIPTSREAVNVLVAIAQDVGMGYMTPQVGNTMCNALGKAIRVKELEIKYGTKVPGGDETRQVLRLSD